MTVSTPPLNDLITALKNGQTDLTEEQWEQVRECEAEIARLNLERERLEAEIAQKKMAIARQEARSQHRQKRRIGLIGRNDPCPCGSGKKFKTCCMSKHQRPALV